MCLYHFAPHSLIANPPPSHPEYQKINSPEEANAGGDPSKMSDAQVKAYLNAHPEIAAAAVGGAKGGAAPEAAAAGSDAAGGADWVHQAGAKKSSTWWGGGNKSAAPASADTYVPPVVPIAAPFSNHQAAAPSLPGAAGGDAGAFGIDDENPFKN